VNAECLGRYGQRTLGCLHESIEQIRHVAGHGVRIGEDGPVDPARLEAPIRRVGGRLTAHIPAGDHVSLTGTARSATPAA